VTERTRRACRRPASFFPDVGGVHGYPRLGEIGTNSACRRTIWRPVYAGFADVFAPSNLPGLIDALRCCPRLRRRAGEDHRPPAQPTAPTRLQEGRAEIDQAFAFDKIELILAALAKSGSNSQRRPERRSVKSPTNLRLTLRLLRLGRLSANLEDCLEREFAAGRKILIGHDFYEGVRAAVIDKDRNPRWSPDKLDQVSVADIEAYLGAAPEPLFPAGSSV
jgi:enoyl-CoA hydratase